MPLVALTGLAAGTIALLASARPVREPKGGFERCPPSRPKMIEASDPVPARGIIDADGRRWSLADLSGDTLRGLNLRNARWAGVDLRRATFVECNFRGCDLNCANLHGTTFKRCRLDSAKLDFAKTDHTRFADCSLLGTGTWMPRFSIDLEGCARDLKPGDVLVVGYNGGVWWDTSRTAR
jgi:hypothetical protein